MKRSYIVSYDKSDEDNYEALEEELKQSDGWWHYLERTWIILTDETPDEIWKRIEEKINKENQLLIIEVNGKVRQGWLKQSAWDWIKENLEK